MSAPQLAAFVGLGAMGRPIARHLQRQAARGCLVWNRNADVAVQHQAEHGTVAVHTLEELARAEPDVVFTCLPTSKQVSEVARTLGALLPEGTVFVDCTSGNPRETRETGAFLEGHGIGMVDAPVSGGPAGAEAGQLSIIVGGPSQHVEAATPLLSSFAKAITHVGPLGSGHAVKAVNNTLNSAHLLLAAEGAACLAAQGIDPARAMDAINQSSGRSLQTEVRLPEEVLTRRFQYNFKLGLMDKDVGIAQQMCGDYFPDAELLQHTKRLVDAATNKFGGDVDYTYLARYVEEQAGLEIRPLEQPKRSQPRK